MSIAAQKQEVVVTPSTVISTWTQEKFDLLKRQCGSDLTNDEFDIFKIAVQRTGLDPFMRQIYAVKRKGKMCIQVGIDGYRLVAERTGGYAGCDDAVLDNEQEPNKATITIYKIVQGQRCSFTASARWSEYYPGHGKESFMWDKMPCTMLAKVAEALALRKGFPADLSGIYTEDEMAQADASQEKANSAKEVQSEVSPKIAPVGFKMTSEKWMLLHKAADTSGHPRVNKAPSSEAEFRSLLGAMNQTTPKAMIVDGGKEFVQEMNSRAKAEFAKEAAIAAMDRESNRLHDIQSQKGCVARL